MPNSMSIASRPGPGPAQHVYPVTITAAGAPAAATVPRGGSFHFNTVDGVVRCGFSAAGNFNPCFETDGYDELSNGTRSMGASGGETMLLIQVSGLVLPTGVAVRVLPINGTGTFGTQPSNDAIQLVSTSAADTMNCNVIGNTSGADTSNGILEAKTMNGTTPVTSTKTDWGDIFAVDCNGAATGTITLREDSGDVTICTIAPGV